jgi:hypothetical protein
MGCIHARNSIAKGPVVYYLDELSKGSDAIQRLRDLQTALVAARDDGYRHIAAILAQHLFEPFMARSEKLQAYLNNYWFDEGKPTVEFTDLQPIAAAYAEGLIKTIDLSLQGERGGRPKPIDGWWIVDHPKFEVLNLVNEHCVVLLIMTPRPTGIGARGIWNPAAEAWSTLQDPASGTSTERIENRTPITERDTATIVAVSSVGDVHRP